MGSGLLCWIGAHGLCALNLLTNREIMMGREKVNLTLASDVPATARAPGLNVPGLNMPGLTDEANAVAAKSVRNHQWRIENSDAINSCAGDVAKDGLPLTQFSGLQGFLTWPGLISIA